MSLERVAKRGAEKVVRADGEVHQLVAPHEDRLPVRALALLSDVGDQPQLRLLAGACIATGLLVGNRRTTRAGVRMLLAHEVATLLKSFVKDNVDRTRPRSAESREDRKLKRSRSSSKEESSFPSGHTAGAAAVARAYSREFPEHGAAALGGAALVAAAQVPRCAHYVSDVGAGAIIGLAADVIADGLWRLSGKVAKSR